MIITRSKLGNGLHLNKVITEKFKSNYIAINLIRPLDKNEVTTNSLLSSILGRGTESYSSKALLERRLEELYGANLNVTISKRGERHILRVSIEWADSRFTGDNSYEEDVISLLKDTLFNPFLPKGLFEESQVLQEKKNLISKIESKVNDKRSLALNRCIEEMCKEEAFSIYQLGYVEDISPIDEKNLTQHYFDLLNTSEIEVVYVGKDNQHIDSNIIPQAYLNRDNIIHVPREDIHKTIKQELKIVEKEDINQGKLVIGYRSTIGYEDKLYSALLVGNEIFGGGPNSKLFKEIREKHSLAYYVGSNLIKHKSIILLDAGIDSNNYDKTVLLIDSQLKNMINGDFTEDEIDIAKKGIKTSSMSIIDNPQLMGEFTLGKILANDQRTLEEMIQDVEKVTKDEIVQAMKTIFIDTFYFMTSQEVKADEEN